MRSTKQEFATLVFFLTTVAVGCLSFGLTRVLMRYRVDTPAGLCLGVGVVFLVLTILTLGMEE